MSKRLWEQTDFYSASKPAFVTRFADFLRTHHDGSEEALETLAARLYDSVFSEEPKNDGAAASRQALLQALIEQPLGLEQISSAALLLMVKGCAEFLVQNLDDDIPLASVAEQLKDYIALLEHRLPKAAQASKQIEHQHQAQQEIIALLRQSHDKDKPLTLINTFRGINVSYDASLRDWHENWATLEIHKYQAVAITIRPLAKVGICPQVWGYEI